jgi:hypothetical protein
MKRQILNLLLIVLVCVLVIPLTLSCAGSPNHDSNSEWDSTGCPAWLLLGNITTRLEDLPPGWYLYLVQGGPSCWCPFNIDYEACVDLQFKDQKPWNNPRRYVMASVYLRREEEAVMYYFIVPDGSVAINITGADEAYIKVSSTQIGEPPLNCTYGAYVTFRKGLYQVSIGSSNEDLRDLCIDEGEEVDAEVAFVIDLATKVASRIP